MKRCSPSLLYKEVQMETTMGHQHISSRLPTAGENQKVLEVFHTVNWNAVSETLWKTVWQYPRKFNIHLLCDPALPFFYTYAREREYVYTKIHPRMSTAASFIMTIYQKQLKWSPTDEWRNKLWYKSHNGKLLSSKHEITTER